jgi:hypothetical protein
VLLQLLQYDVIFGRRSGRQARHEPVPEDEREKVVDAQLFTIVLKVWERERRCSSKSASSLIESIDSRNISS